MSTELVLAIDQGTTGTTCLVVDRELRIVARATREFPQHFPRPGWVEHDPEEIWASVCDALRAALATPGVDPGRIVAIGITNQRETTVVWERASGRPIHRALVWQDRRTAAHCERLAEAGHLELVRARTGLVLDPYFSASKLAWVLDHVDGARAAAASGALAAGTIDAFLLHRLTGGDVHATEPSNACRTSLFSLSTGAWDPELCALFEVPERVLPAVIDSDACMGSTRGVPGLPDGIPIHGCAGDQQAALFGQACFAAGEAKCTYGTGAFVLLNTGDRPVPSRHGLLTSVAWRIGGRTTYCLEGSSFMAGATVQWLRDGLGIIADAREVEALARQVDGSDGVVLVPAHAGLGAPHWRAHARGLIAGLTRGSTRAHLARAALEGIALQVADLLEAMVADLGAPLLTLRVDGGAAANDLLMQIQSDLLGVRLVRPHSLEATSFGAAALAGLGAGLWPSLERLGRTTRVEREFVPQAEPGKTEALRGAWRTWVARA